MPQESPEEPIRRFEFRTGLLPLEDHQLLPQSRAFQREPVLGRRRALRYVAIATKTDLIKIIVSNPLESGESY